MRILLDAMGSDNGACEFVRAAIMAIEEMDVDIILVGDREELSRTIKENDPEGEFAKRLGIIHASEVIDMHDDPLKSMKSKPDSSMACALRALNEGRGDALISAGNTGALLTQATLITKRIHGIRRAALAPVVPTAKGFCVLIDSGANAECTPEYLYQFALMGSYYSEHALGVKSPKVGLLNNGAEDHKGDEVHKEAYKLMKDAGENGKIRFIGNIEGRDGPLGVADVIVADGFSGNVYLKTIEGVGMFFAKELKNMFMSSLKGKLAGLLMKDEIMNFKRKIDYNDAGGAPLLGIRKPIIKAHGSAKAKSIYYCIIQAIDYIDSGMTIKLENSLKEGNGTHE